MNSTESFAGCDQAHDAVDNARGSRVICQSMANNYVRSGAIVPKHLEDNVGMNELHTL